MNYPLSKEAVPLAGNATEIACTGVSSYTVCLLLTRFASHGRIHSLVKNFRSRPMHYSFHRTALQPCMITSSNILHISQKDNRTIADFFWLSVHLHNNIVLTHKCLLYALRAKSES